MTAGQRPSPSPSVATAALASSPDLRATPAHPRLHIRWPHSPAFNPLRSLKNQVQDAERRKSKMYTTFHSCRRAAISLDLLAEGAALSQPGLAARRLAQHGAARPA